MNKLSDIIISNPEKLERIKKAILQDGAGNFFVLSDFDKTLIKEFTNGKSVVSLISILRDGNYLTPDYAAKAHALYNKYHAIEIDPNIPSEEKDKMMHKWWTTHFALLIQSGLNKKDIEKAINSGKAELREGFNKLADILNRRNIPLVILSSSGLGIDAIAMYLEKANKLYNNIYIVSNAFEWDKNGNATGVKQPIIHSLNKTWLSVKNFPFFGKIKNRKNIIILGDSLDDIDMVKGFEYDNLLKIGFLNDNIEKNIELYKKNYDVVILNDGSMDYVNEILERFK